MTSKAQILKSIRQKCRDCSCEQPLEVRKCPVTACGLWPYRFGVDPTPSKRGFAKNPPPTRVNIGKEGGSSCQ